MSTAEHKTDPWSSFDYSTASRKESNMDPELASIVSSLSGLSNPSGTHLISGPQQLGGFRRSSLNSNNGSDVESELIFQGHVSPTARRSTLSVGAVPTATSSSGHRLAMLGHYSASINTGALQASNQGGSFFERFGRSLAEATREVEQNLGSHASRNLRRDSVPNGSGSIDILSRVSTGTAIAVDEQNRRKASVSSDALESVSESLSLQNETNASKNIWNVANAPVFRPNQMESVVNPELYQSMYCGFPYGLFGHYTAGVANNGPSSVYLPNSTYTAGVQPVNMGDADDAVSRNADQPEGTGGGQFVFPVGTPLVYFPNNAATPTVSSNSTAANANTTTASPAAPAAANVMPYAHPRYSPNDLQKSKPKVNPYLQPNVRSHNSGSTISQRTVTKVPIQSPQDGNNHYYQSHAHKNYASLQPQKHQQNLERQQNSQSPAQSQQQQVNTQPQVHSQPQQHQMSSGTGSKRNGKNQQTIVRSPLLEEFRTNPTNKSYKLHEIYGSALEFCKDQHGSRFIQQELANATDIEKEIIFNEIRDRAIELSHDVFGNYVIQKFFEFGTKTQKDILVGQFKGKLEMLSLEMYACRVIQRAFEFIDEEQKIELVTELSSCVLTMIKDQNGNHVIQKTIECIPMSKLPFILESLKGQIYHLSTHFYGCRVVQRLLEYGSKQDQEEILNELDQFIPYLVQDQYGNYVIQHILQRGGNDPASNHIDKSKQDIVDTISKTVVEFSKHKFASNVVEKTILYGSPSQTRQVLDKILPKNEEHAANLEDTSPLILMMRDQYANYVVQKLVGVATGNDKKLIVIAIRSYLERLNKNNTLGNRHLASVEKLAALVEKVKV